MQQSQDAFMKDICPWKKCLSIAALNFFSKMKKIQTIDNRKIILNIALSLNNDIAKIKDYSIGVVNFKRDVGIDHCGYDRLIDLKVIYHIAVERMRYFR